MPPSITASTSSSSITRCDDNEEHHIASSSIVVLGIAGATASGKSTLATAIVHLLSHTAHVVRTPINLDWFLDMSRMPYHSHDVDDLLLEDNDQPRRLRNFETPVGVRYDLLHTELQRLQDFLYKEQQKTSERATVFVLRALSPVTVPLEICWKDPPKDNDQQSLSLQRRIYVIVEGFLLFYDRIVAQQVLTARFWIEASLHTTMTRRCHRELPTRQYHRPTEVTHFQAWFRRAIWSYYEKYRDTQLQHGTPLCMLYAKDDDENPQQLLEEVQSYLMEYGLLSPEEEADNDNALQHAVQTLTELIARDTVPALTHVGDRQAMQWVADAEDAEAVGDFQQARVLYRKVLQTSKLVANFVGL